MPAMLDCDLSMGQASPGLVDPDEPKKKETPATLNNHYQPRLTINQGGRVQKVRLFISNDTYKGGGERGEEDNMGVHPR